MVTAKYGLEMTSFIVENVSLPPEVEQAIDKRSSMSAVGNLNDTSSSRWRKAWRKAEAPAGPRPRWRLG